MSIVSQNLAEAVKLIEENISATPNTLQYQEDVKIWLDRFEELKQTVAQIEDDWDEQLEIEEQQEEA